MCIGGGGGGGGEGGHFYNEDKHRRIVFTAFFYGYPLTKQEHRMRVPTLDCSCI